MLQNYLIEANITTKYVGMNYVTKKICDIRV